MADFSRRAQERIRRTVRDHERERPAPSGRRRKYPVGGGGIRFRWAELTEDLVSGATASVQFLKWDSNSSDFVEDTGATGEVRAKFSFSDGPVPSGTRITCFKQFGVWWLEDTSWCPESA